MEKKSIKLLAVLSFLIGIFLLINSKAGITGNAISERTSSLGSIFG